MSAALRMLTLAVNAIVTRAAAGLPDDCDTVSVAAPTQSMVVPKTRLYPGSPTHRQGVQWGCPELGVITPAGLGAALGQKESSHSQPELDGARPLPSTLLSASRPLPAPVSPEDRVAPAHRRCKSSGGDEGQHCRVRWVHRTGQVGWAPAMHLQPMAFLTI